MIADELRQVIAEHFLNDTQPGKLLANIANRVEALEANPHLEPDGSTSWNEPRSPRELLEAFLARLDHTCALSCPAADLVAAIDDTLTADESLHGPRP